MKLKKFAALGLTSAMLLSATGVSSFAFEQPSWFGSYNDESTRAWVENMIDGTSQALPTWEEAYAYLDYDAASDEIRDMILEARCNIVYSPKARWTVDGQIALKNADGTTTALPEFSDVYPDDWNLDDITAKYIENASYLEEPADAVSAARSAGFADMVTVPKHTEGLQAPIFYTFTGSGSTVRAYAATMPSGYTINFGVKNLDTNKDIGWIGNLDKYQSIKWETVNGVRYGVRCSTYNNMYSAYVVVEDIQG